MSLIASRYRGLYASLFVVFLLFGTSMTIVGASLPTILSDFSWSYGVAGVVIAAGAAGYFLASLAGGAFLKRIGAKWTSALGLALSALGLAFFASTPSALLNLALNALIGLGQGLIEPTVNWAVVRMDEKGDGRAMNLIHGSFAIGAVAGPMALGLLLGAGLVWTLLYRAIAVLFAVIAAIMVFLPFEVLERRESGKAAVPSADAAAGGGSGGDSPVAREKAAGTPLGRRPTYWIGFVGLLVYVGTEQGISNWIAEYFVKVFSANPAVAAGMVSLFWIGLLAGRFGAPALYRGTRQDSLLAAASVLLALTLISLNVVGFAGAVPFWTGPVLTFLAGLGCSIIYPVTISLVGASSPDEQERAVSFAVAGGGLGLFAFPFIMSWVSQAWGIRAGFLGYALIAALTCAASFALASAYMKEKRDREA
ncbi:MAG TPA: MFS transporter [Rectinemataceae bacterium]|nr:MFS transporter [Rectinemataceae bacterium]